MSGLHVPHSRTPPLKGSTVEAIITKYVGPTDRKGSRISAKVKGGERIMVPYRSDIDSYANHLHAATLLRDKLQWSGPLVGGDIAGGYAFVIVK